MATDSSAAGYLSPATAAVYGDALDDVLHDAVVGMTGIAGSLVRPRWQPEAPQQPDFSVDWVAFGVVRTVVDVFAYEGHHAAGGGSDSVERDELLFVLHSFYGPNSHAYCERFRDGFEISQNRDVLKAAGVGLVEVGEATILPALLKEKWVRRVDVTVTYRRRTSRTYAVLSLTSANGTLVTDVPATTTPIVVPNP